MEAAAAAGQMVIHAGAQRQPWEVIAALPEPKSLGTRHYPVPHARLIEAIRHEAGALGLGITKEEFAITKAGEKLFALFQFDQGRNGHATALGLRNAVDQSMAIRAVAGAKVFVCDNLSLSGDEFLFQRKNTSGLGITGRIIDMVKTGFSKFVAASEKFEARVKVLQQEPVSIGGAEAAIYRAFVRHQVAPLRLLPQVHEAYFTKGLRDQEYPEVDRTVWGLHNAFTRVFKELPPAPKFVATRKLGQVLGL